MCITLMEEQRTLAGRRQFELARKGPALGFARR
jgi:hypothetical protein